MLRQRRRPSLQPSSQPTPPSDHHSKSSRSFPLPAIFLLLSIPRLTSALLSPLADCDETFNYWEPMHYLIFSHGFQTWEYSPHFALRSYVYLLPYAATAKLSILLSDLSAPYISLHLSEKIISFYAVRIFQALLSALVESLFYKATFSSFGTRVSNFLLLFLLTSPGIFRAAVEFLPSSFAMISVTAAFSAWMTDRFFTAVAIIAIGSLLGWVYMALLALPMALHVIWKRGLLRFTAWSLLSGGAILSAMALIDSYYFGRTVLAPVNHVLYNIFPPEGAGPNLFGTESWTFYATNLVLNCNISLFLLISYFPLFFLHIVAICNHTAASPELWKRLLFLSPAYLWLALFFALPHKEERFLAPCYTLIALISAVALNDWLDIFARFVAGPSTRTRSRRQRAPPRWTAIFNNCICALVLTLTVVASMSRIVRQISAYSAPLRLYTHLSEVELRGGAGPRDAEDSFDAARDVNICVGKEWYRFPTSFFLPDRRFRIRFVRDGFSGLLPKPFLDGELATRRVADGMNALNEEDALQYYNVSEGCHYFVDFDLSHRGGDSKAEDVAIAEGAGVVVAQFKMLDGEMSAAGFRAFALPLPSFEQRLVYGNYQLIRNVELLPIVQ